MASPSLANAKHLLVLMILATALAAAHGRVASAGSAVFELRRKVGGVGGDHLANLRLHDVQRHGVDFSLGGNPVTEKAG